MSEFRTHADRPAAVTGITKITLGAGETSSPVYTPISCGIWAKPGAGGSMTVEATGSLPADIEAGIATWHPWDAGSVSSAASQLLLHATAVRFIAVTAAGVGEVSV